MITEETILKIQIKDKDIDNFKSIFKKLNKPQAGYNQMSFTTPEVKLISKIKDNLNIKEDEKN